MLSKVGCLNGGRGCADIFTTWIAPPGFHSLWEADRSGGTAAVCLDAAQAEKVDRPSEIDRGVFWWTDRHTYPTIDLPFATCWLPMTGRLDPALTKTFRESGK